jgi:hypothetical protein
VPPTNRPICILQPQGVSHSWARHPRCSSRHRMVIDIVQIASSVFSAWKLWCNGPFRTYDDSSCSELEMNVRPVRKYLLPDPQDSKAPSEHRAFDERSESELAIMLLEAFNEGKAMTFSWLNTTRMTKSKNF